LTTHRPRLVGVVDKMLVLKAGRQVASGGAREMLETVRKLQVVKVLGADKEPGATPQEGEFYMAQVETTKEGLDLLAGLKVQPGMSVDVVIKAGERSFMSYLLKPLTDKMARAFKD